MNKNNSTNDVITNKSGYGRGMIYDEAGYGILDNSPEGEGELRDLGFGQHKIEISFDDWVAVM